MKKLNKKGFTLIELLAVIVILAIVAAVSMTVIVPMISGQANKGAETSVKELNKQVANSCSAAGATDAYGKFEAAKYYADSTASDSNTVTVAECGTSTGCYISLDGADAANFVKGMNISGDMPDHVEMTVKNCQVQNDYCVRYVGGQFDKLTVKEDNNATKADTTSTTWKCTH